MMPMHARKKLSDTNGEKKGLMLEFRIARKRRDTSWSLQMLRNAVAIGVKHGGLGGV
jgi:hypothetical protein